ncbi:MAG: helix-turn-helix domain-containing protein [Thermoplasmata archaeon]
MSLNDLLDSGIDLKEEYEKASSTLESIGLSNYEARAYIALVAHGYGDAETIAETSGIPRTSSYKVLQSLCQKGFAMSTSGRPKIFKPEEPKKLMEKIIPPITDTFDKLETLSEIMRDRGEPQLVYTITGKSRVIAKIGELLDKSSKSVIIASPNFHEIRAPLAKKIDNAIGRGVSITIITGAGQKVPENAKVVHKNRLIASDVIINGTTALLASADLAACGFTDNASLAKHLENFLEILIEH